MKKIVLPAKRKASTVRKPVRAVAAKARASGGYGSASKSIRKRSKR